MFSFLIDTFIHSECCDPLTCKLVPNAECDLGECCEKCKLLGGSHVCRSSNSNECDFAEYCNGTSPHVS